MCAADINHEDSLSLLHSVDGYPLLRLLFIPNRNRNPETITNMLSFSLSTISNFQFSIPNAGARRLVLETG